MTAKNEFTFTVLGYTITCIPEGGEFFSEQSFRFTAEKNDETFELKTKFNNELVRDLCCIMGLDPVKELANIALSEIKTELYELEGMTDVTQNTF